MISQEVPNDHRVIDATAGTVELKGRNTLGVRAEAAGVARLRMRSGNEVPYNVSAGDYLFGEFTHAVNPGTTVLLTEVYRAAAFTNIGPGTNP